ncbi:hypothetical protein GCK32_013289, partial [Trichostrongylus colubriformis]
TGPDHRRVLPLLGVELQEKRPSNLKSHIFRKYRRLRHSTAMWSNGEKPSHRTNLRKRGTQASTSSQRRLPPKSDPFQKCSMCSNDIAGFLQHTSNIRSVVLSCAHVVCDNCFEKLVSTPFQTKNRGYVKCVLCRSTVTYTLLPTLDDIIPLTSCGACDGQLGDQECVQCGMR